MTAVLDAPASAGVVELTHVYHGRGAARELMRRREDEVLLCGPAGTGKSRACLEKLNIAALKYPGLRGLIVRQVRDTLPSTALETFEKYVITEQLAAGAVVYRSGSGRRPARYEYNNGSELWIAGLDKPSKIMSTEFDMIYIQEATEVTANGWESLTTRLRSEVMPYRQLIADCNPESATHWLNQRCQSGATVMVHSRHEDNPRLVHEDGTRTELGVEYLAKLDRLTGVRKLRLRDGIWAAAEGVIWGSYDPARHLIPAFPIPPDWPRIWTVDFGMVHPFVWQAWAVDPEGRLFRYREIHMSGRMVEDHAKQIMGIVCPGATWDDAGKRWIGGTWIEPKPQKIICDHDTEDRETLARYLAMPNHPADKRVKPGLEAVESRFRDDRLFFLRDGRVQVLLPGTGKPKGVAYGLAEIDEKARDAHLPLRTEDEIGGYVWDANKEQPVKEDDDGCDATRYAVSNFDLKGTGDVLRWLD